MLQSNGADYKEYERMLKMEIAPILNQLIGKMKMKSFINTSVVSHPQIIWLNQFSTTDFWGANGQHNVDIFSEKINQYNLILRRVFK